MNALVLLGLTLFAAIVAKALVSTMPDFALKLITPSVGAVPSKSCKVVDVSAASTTRMLSMKYAEPFGPDSPRPKYVAPAAIAPIRACEFAVPAGGVAVRSTVTVPQTPLPAIGLPVVIAAIRLLFPTVLVNGLFDGRTVLEANR